MHPVRPRPASWTWQGQPHAGPAPCHAVACRQWPAVASADLQEHSLFQVPCRQCSTGSCRARPAPCRETAGSYVMLEAVQCWKVQWWDLGTGTIEAALGSKIQVQGVHCALTSCRRCNFSENAKITLLRTFIQGWGCVGSSWNFPLQCWVVSHKGTGWHLNNQTATRSARAQSKPANAIGAAPSADERQTGMVRTCVTQGLMAALAMLSPRIPESSRVPTQTPQIGSKSTQHK